MIRKFLTLVTLIIVILRVAGIMPVSALQNASGMSETNNLYLPFAVNFKPNHVQISYALVLTNTGTGTVSLMNVYVAIPQSYLNQQLESLNFSVPYEMKVDQYGQAVALFTFTNIAPHEQVVINWQARASISLLDLKLDPAQVQTIAQVPPEIVSQYTADGSMYRLDSSVIQAAAVEAAGGATNLYWLARNIHDYVADRLVYVDDDRWNDAETVFLQQHGSCTEYTYLFVALSRANGLPARYVGATMQRGPGTSVDTNYHRWAEVYLPPYGWVPVDVQADDGTVISHDHFGALSDGGFVTTISGGGSEYLSWNYHDRYTYYSSGMVSIERLRTFTWADLDE